MKRFLSVAFLIIGLSAYAAGPKVVGSSHAMSGYDGKDMTLEVVGSPTGEGITLNTDYDYPLLPPERDKLLSLIQTAAKKIDIAESNKTTIFYKMEIGRFSTDDAAMIIVSFQTDGYESSYASVQILNGGRNVILMLNKKDAQDLTSNLAAATNPRDDYQKQVELFK